MSEGNELGGMFKADGLGHKLGPLPVWAWAGILAVGVFVYYRFFGSSAASTAGQPTTASTTSTASGYPDYSNTGTGSAYDTSSFASSPTGYTDNSSWEAAAINEASSFGSTPLAVQQAVDTGLNGGSFTTDQASLWNQILTSLGAPPTGTLGTPSTTTTANKANLQFLYQGSGPGGSGGAISLLNTQTGKTVQIGTTGGYSDYTALANMLGGAPAFEAPSIASHAAPTAQNYTNAQQYIQEVS